MAHSGCVEQVDFSINEKSVDEVMLSVLIVNYNGVKTLGDCIDSISRLVSLPYEVIVVDNASTDGSCAYIKKYFPNVRLISCERNLGFAGGNNLGAQAAKGKYLLLLNNDTTLLTDIKPAIEIFEKYAHIGIVGGKMLGSNGEYRYSAGYFPSPFRLIKISFLYKKKGAFRKGDFPLDGNSGIYPVDWVEGSFLITRLSIWQELNGLDEGYFMYGEDVDFCRRVRILGFRAAYCPRISYIHYGGYDSDRLPWIVKGFFRYHQKFSNRFEQWLAWTILYAGLLTRVLVNGFLFLITRTPARRIKAKACIMALKSKN